MKAFILILALVLFCSITRAHTIYKGRMFQNRAPSRDVLAATPVWNLESGEPPISVTKAYKLALAYLRVHIDPDFHGLAFSVMLQQVFNGEPVPANGRGYWEVVFTDMGNDSGTSSVVTADDGAKGTKRVPAQFFINILFDGSIVGPTENKS